MTQTNETEAREPYVLIKRDLFWKPDSCGYTGVLSEAGRYYLENGLVDGHYPVAPAYDPKHEWLEVYGIPLSSAPKFTSNCLPDVKIKYLEADLASEKKRADEAEAELTRLKAGSQWHPIETIANLNPESLVLASCHADDEFPDGRVMIWKVRILLDNIRRGNSTPEHLRYPASHWTPLPTPPEGE